MSKSDVPHRYSRRKSETLPFVLCLVVMLIVATGAGLSAYSLRPQPKQPAHHRRHVHGKVVNA
jgi:hypothetical protein